MKLKLGTIVLALLMLAWTYPKFSFTPPVVQLVNDSLFVSWSATVPDAIPPIDSATVGNCTVLEPTCIDPALGRRFSFPTDGPLGTIGGTFGYDVSNIVPGTTITGTLSGFTYRFEIPSEEATQTWTYTLPLPPPEPPAAPLMENPATVAYDSAANQVIISQDITNIESSLDSLVVGDCSPAQSTTCRYITHPALAEITLTSIFRYTAPAEGETITGRGNARAWRNELSSDLVIAPSDWSYTTPIVVDSSPPIPLQFDVPTIIFQSGIDTTTLPPPDTTPPPPDTMPPPPVGTYTPELPRVYINTTTRPAELRVINVAPGGLKAALNAAQCGDALVLNARQNYVGNFILPFRSCQSQPITIRTDGALLPKGWRAHPIDTLTMPSIYSVTSAPVLKFSDGTEGWHLLALTFRNRSPILASGRSQTWNTIHIAGSTHWTSDPAILPGYITLEQVIVLGADDQDMRRCVTLGARWVAIIDSYLAGCHDMGSDAQAIGGWGGTGPYKIVNNYLEASGENFMLGGTDAPPGNPTPADIEIRLNHFNAPPEWQSTHPGFVPVPGTCSGSGVCAWPRKNLFEIKDGQRYLVEYNLFEHNWPKAQAGTGILWQSVDGANSAISDVTFRYNIIASTPGLFAGCINKLKTTGTAPPCKRLAIVNNLWIGILDPIAGNLGASRGFQLYGNAQGTLIDKNTAVWPGTQGYNSFVFAGTAREGTVITNNLICKTKYAITGSGTSGQATLDKYDPTAVVDKNLFYEAPSGGRIVGQYYDATPCPQTSVANVLAGHIPSPGSYLGTDGAPVGVDVSKLPNIQRVRSGR